MNNTHPTAGSCSSSVPWIELPRDVTANILSRLGPVEIMDSAEKVCTTWRSLCAEPSMWRVIHIKKPDQRHRNYNVGVIYRLAVDRSQGELIEISIDHVGTDDLLQYISDRSSQLKRLRLLLCNSISAHGLNTALENFPRLEELHLVFDSFDIDQAISVSCPMLKSFTFNNSGRMLAFMEKDDSHALSISKNMPNLCHLSLFGNMLSNEGLEAILDGCPNLESLDIRQCFRVDLQCDLGRRCSEQIKELRCNLDASANYGWSDQIYGSNPEFGDYLDELVDYLGYVDGEFDNYDYCIDWYLVNHYH